MKKNQLENKDCGCSDGCCEPKKKNTFWSKLIFLAIILVASSIILIKLVGGNDNQAVKPSNIQVTDTINKSDSVNKSSSGESCDSSKATSCCPK